MSNIEIENKRDLELQATELFYRGWTQELPLVELVKSNHENIDLNKELYQINDTYFLKNFSSIVNHQGKVEFYLAGERIIWKYFEKDNSYGLKAESFGWFNKKMKRIFAYWLLTKCKHIGKVRLSQNIGSYDISLVYINGHLIELGMNHRTAYFKKTTKDKFKNLYYKKLSEEKQSKLDSWLDNLVNYRTAEYEGGSPYMDEDISFGEEFIEDAIENINRTFELLETYVEYPTLKEYIKEKIEELGL